MHDSMESSMCYESCSIRYNVVCIFSQDSVDSLSKKKIPSHNLMQKVLYNTVAHSVSAGNVVSFSATVSDPENTLETYKR